MRQFFATFLCLISVSPIYAAVSTTVSTPSISPQTPQLGQAVVISAKVSSGSGNPTGTLTFLDGGTTLGSAALSSGIGTLSLAGLVVGNHTITASYGGDSSFAPSVSGAAVVSVARATSNISPPKLLSATAIFGQPLVFSSAVTVFGSGARPSGNVRFVDGSATLGEVPVDQGGLATVSATALAVGAHNVIALYLGDANYAPSTSTTLALNVQATPSVSLTSSANPAQPGVVVVLAGVVASPSVTAPKPSGSVSINEGTKVLGTAALNSLAGFSFALPVGLLVPGAHSLTANYNGDSLNTIATSPILIQQIALASTQVTLSIAINAGVVTLTSNITGSGASGPSGAIQFQDVTAGTALTSVQIKSGTAIATLPPPLPVGHQIQAVYFGDTSNSGASSPPKILIVPLNGFSFQLQSYASEQLVTLFGSGLSLVSLSASSGSLPVSLGGISVDVTDSAQVKRSALLIYVSQSQINLVLPAGMAAGTAQLTVSGASGGPLTVSIPISTVSPALASASADGTGAAAAQILRVHPNGLQEPAQFVATFDPTTGSWQPVTFHFNGDTLYLILYGTGLKNARSPATCTVGGLSIIPLFAGAQGTFPGLDQVNLLLPSSLDGRGTVDVVCTADGLNSNAVKVAF